MGLLGKKLPSKFGIGAKKKKKEPSLFLRDKDPQVQQRNNSGGPGLS